MHLLRAEKYPKADSWAKTAQEPEVTQTGSPNVPPSYSTAAVVTADV